MTDGDEFAGEFTEQRDEPNDNKGGAGGAHGGQQGAAGQGEQTGDQKAAADESAIPADTMDVIQNGVANKKERGRALWNVLIVLRRHGFTVDDSIALFEKYPAGIANAYRGRLRDEIERVYRKINRRQAAVALDAATVRAMLENASKDKVVELFIALVPAADLTPVDIDALTRLVAKKSGVGLRPLQATLKQAQAKHAAEQAAAAAEQAAAARAKRRAERTDPRPMVPAPISSDPWKPIMATINAVLSASTEPEPPARDIDRYMTRSRKISAPRMHLFSAKEEERALPAPEQWVLHRMSEIEVAELIEGYIDFYVKTYEGDVSVHLNTAYVRHYVRRHDDVLPLAVTIATLPIMLGDGALLALEGLDRKRGIIFKVPQELRAALPRREQCTDAAVCSAMKLLCDDWLHDVATDYVGKCVLIAIALTIIERVLLPERPVFWVTAGKARSGKTTTLMMLIMALTGERPAAAAWSNDEDERRKALLGYLLSGVPYILWDNIARGTQISCPHIEKACTSEFYSDRRLGVTEIETAAASAIQLFTGNNTSPRGDLASRSLRARLIVDRPDPENRTFKHPDPIGWTADNRAKILRALYTVLLGNPMLDQPHDAAGGTRFKAWYRLIGSAIEHAAKLTTKAAADEREIVDRATREQMDKAAAPPALVDFKTLFLSQEAESDEESSTLGEALTILLRLDQVEFKGAKVASLINAGEHDGIVLRDWLYPEGVSANFTATARSVGKRLNDYIDNTVQVGDDVLTLRRRTVDNAFVYFVAKTAGLQCSGV